MLCPKMQEKIVQPKETQFFLSLFEYIIENPKSLSWYLSVAAKNDIIIFLGKKASISLLNDSE